MTQEKMSCIYVACLAAYVNGKLQGTWIDCDSDTDGIWIKMNKMLGNCTQPDANESAVRDFENWMGVKIDDYETTEQIAELVELVKEKGKAFAAYCHHYSKDATPEKFQARYLGKFKSDEDFVQRQLFGNGMLAKLEKLGILETYLDYEAIADDWFVNTYLALDVGYEETYVFSRQ